MQLFHLASGAAAAEARKRGRRSAAFMVTVCVSDGVAAGQAFILTLPYLLFCNVSDWLGGQELILTLPYLVFCNGCCFATGYS